jgi:hypothetical protein
MFQIQQVIKHGTDIIRPFVDGMYDFVPTLRRSLGLPLLARVIRNDTDSRLDFYYMLHN